MIITPLTRAQMARTQKNKGKLTIRWMRNVAQIEHRVLNRY